MTKSYHIIHIHIWQQMTVTEYGEHLGVGVFWGKCLCPEFIQSKATVR